MTGPVPHDLDPGISDLWLTFCSHCYFRTVKDQFICFTPQLGDNALYRKDYRMRARWVTQTQEPHLPREVTYSGEMAWEASASNQTASAELRNTNIAFRVLAYTNIDALEIPRSVIIKKYFNGPQNLFILSETVSIEVTNCLRKISIQSFVPKVPGQVYLWDLRYEKATPPARVTTMSEKWLTTNETKRLYDLAVQPASEAN
jgi:hypothetical protein